MKFHLLSDLHLEFKPNFTLANPGAETLVLAGDIMVLKNPDLKFLDTCMELYDNVIWVLGNHEFYGMDYEDALATAQYLAEESGVMLADIEFDTHYFELGGVKILASTLWTDCASGAAAPQVAHQVNDFRVIENFDVYKSLQLHDDTLAKFSAHDADLVITHHAPIVIKHPAFPISPITYAFCSTDIIPSQKVWMYGHTHHNIDYIHDGTRIISNQVGYPFEYPKIYNPDLILDLSLEELLIAEYIKENYQK